MGYPPNPVEEAERRRERVLRLLRAVWPSPERYLAAEVAMVLRLPAQTVANDLGVLLARGLVERQEHEHRAGPHARWTWRAALPHVAEGRAS